MDNRESIVARTLTPTVIVCRYMLQGFLQLALVLTLVHFIGEMYPYILANRECFDVILVEDIPYRLCHEYYSPGTLLGREAAYVGVAFLFLILTVFCVVGPRLVGRWQFRLSSRLRSCAATIAAIRTALLAFLSQLNVIMDALAPLARPLQTSEEDEPADIVAKQFSELLVIHRIGSATAFA